MAKTKKPRKHRKLDRSLPEMRPNAGGIDIGATEVFVAVPADRDTDSVRSFATFTQDLYELADWLQRCRVDTVAMESHRRLLDPAVPDSGGSGYRSPFGQCPACAPCSRSKIGRVGLPMASIPALGRLAEGVVPPGAGGLRDSFSDATSAKSR